MATGGSFPPRISYILAELEDTVEVFTPIKTASRVKYTCFDVSRHYIVFGTTAGGVIILHHDSFGYVKTLSVKEGPVCQTALAPDDNIIGFATVRGVTLVMEHNAERGAAQAQRLQLSYEHRGALITCMQWNVSSSKLFIGDDKGKVSVINVSTSRTRNIFQVPSTTLMKLDSKIVQLDFAQDHLLVSTITKCYLCDTNKEQFLTVGKKLRDGEYGACFYPGLRSVDPCTIYSARPGSRMWEVDIKGSVCCTHQFKAALAIKPEKLYTFRYEVNMEEGSQEYKPQATTFHKLLLVWPSTEDSPFIFTWSDNGAYIFDPRKAEVIMWIEDLKGIKDAKCQRGDIYVHYLDGKFSKYTLMTVEQGVCRLYQQGLVLHGAQLLLLKKASLCSSRLNIHVPASFMLDMLQKASEMGKSYLFSGLSSILNSLGLSPDKMSQSSRSSSAMSEPVRLNSGIYVVNKLIRDADDDAAPAVCLSRWRSASPVFRHNSRSPHSSPSRSSDRGPYSPKSQRSASVYSGTLKDASAKLRKSSSIRTPDSTDSGTSGRVSEMSDETQSSPSGKELHNKENWQSFTQSQNNHNVNELKNSLELNLASNSLITTPTHSSSQKPTKPLSNGSIDSTINGDECNNNGSSGTPSISLNLCDLSKESNSTEKRVSFKNKVSTSSDESFASSRLATEEKLVNGIDKVEDSVFSPAEHPEIFYEDYYSYAGLAMPSSMLVPTLDISLLFGNDTDLQNIKESLSNKIATGKNILMRNLKGLEQRLKQDLKPDLLDVKSKHSETTQLTSPVSHSETEKSSSEFHSVDRHFWSFMPAIDATELINSTKNIWSQTRDAAVLFDKTKVSSILESWVNDLHGAQINVIESVINFLQNYQNPSSHSYKDDDTLRSTCSQITSQESSPSENCEISDRLEQEDPSVSDSKSYEDDKHVDSAHSLNVEGSDSSTLRTESVLGKLSNLEDFVFVYDPFRLSSEEHQMMLDLAMMCFQLEVWGKISRVMNIRSTILKSKSDEIQKISDKKDIESSTVLRHSESAHAFQKSDYSSANSLKVQKRPLCNQISDPGSSRTFISEETIKENLDFDHNHTVPSVYNDSYAAAFLQNYFHLFDVQRLRELLNVLNQPCIRTWNIMLAGASLLSGSDEFTKKMAADQFETAVSCLERSFIGAILVSHLLKIFRANTSRAIELCLQRSYHVAPLDVFYLSKSCDTHPKPFLTYVSHFLECIPDVQRPKVLDKLLHLNEVRKGWITGMLSCENEVDVSLLKCSCGWPRPGSHLHPWKFSELILAVISSDNMKNAFLELCFNSGFWLGYLQLVKLLGLHEIHRKVVICLADVNLLSDEKLGYLPSSIEEWSMFMQMLSQSIKNPGFVACISCSEKHPVVTSSDSESWSCTLQWEAVAKVALSSIDPIKVLQMLQDIDLPAGSFSPHFYRSIIMSFMINKQQSALTHRTLTTVGSYLWSRRLQTLSPEIRHVFQSEKEKPSKSSPETKELTDVKDVLKGSHYYLEEPEGHWGVATCLNTTCKVCKMPLTSHLSSSQGGINIYRCGHAYHTSCSSEGFCIACLSSTCDTGS